VAREAVSRIEAPARREEVDVARARVATIDAQIAVLEKAIADADVATFTKRWKAALAIEREDHFPFAHPAQDKFLAFAVEHALADVAKHVAAIVTEHREPADRKRLKPLIDRANKLR
jgi:hypothetical protein